MKKYDPTQDPEFIAALKLQEMNIRWSKESRAVDLGIKLIRSSMIISTVFLILTAVFHGRLREYFINATIIGPVISIIFVSYVFIFFFRKISKK